MEAAERVSSEMKHSYWQLKSLLVLHPPPDGTLQRRMGCVMSSLALHNFCDYSTVLRDDALQPPSALFDQDFPICSAATIYSLLFAHQKQLFTIHKCH